VATAREHRPSPELRAETAGPVLCLYDPRHRFSAALWFAGRLARATGAPLVVEAAELRGTRGRSALERAAMLTQSTRASIVVARAAGEMTAALTHPHASAALARATRTPTVLVPPCAVTGESGDQGGAVTVVCGVAAGSSARPVARAGRTVARALGGRMMLVHAYDRPLPAGVVPAPGAALPVSPEEIEASARDSAWRRLEEAAGFFDGDAILRVERGAAADGLAHCAARCGARLIVTGTPRHGALLGALLGSPAWELARSAPVPVMLVPAD
jgi:nucleotide-binding universal stress UspA family protein